MSIGLVNIETAFTLERALSMFGMAYFVEQAQFEGDYKVYGCGLFKPGEAYDGFVDAYSHGEMLGIIGLTIEEEILSLHEGSLRQLLGQILMRAPKIFMTDFTSVEFAPHYDIQGVTHGGHPAWLCPVEQARGTWMGHIRIPMNINDSSGMAFGKNEVVAVYDENVKIGPDWEVENPDETELVAIVAKDLGDCIVGALLQLPMILLPDIYGSVRDASPGGRKRIQNHPMIRFATRYGIANQVATSRPELKELFEALRKGELKPVPKQLVDMAQIEAYATLEKMLPQPAPAEDVDQLDAALSVFGDPDDTSDEVEVFGPAQERVVSPDGTDSPDLYLEYGQPMVVSPAGIMDTVARNMPKIVKPGDRFDPVTHYGEYYYNDGPGMVFSNPAGEKTPYHGPGRDWEGFDVVADIFRMTFDFGVDCPTIVSLGCGFGYDVLRFRKKGWDAWGVDISEWSVHQAPRGARDYIALGNICDQRTQRMLPKEPHMVITFDFWEHIWRKDIDGLLANLAKWMQPGSFMANIICTNGRGERDMTVQPGDGFTLENSWFLISGHVTGRRWHWWANKFHEHGFKARLDKAFLFQVTRSEDAGMSQAMSWRARNLLIVERV